MKGEDEVKTKVEELHSKPWYYNSISRQECIDLISDKAAEGDILIRDESISGDFVLSWRSGTGTKHLTITTTDEKYHFRG